MTYNGLLRSVGKGERAAFTTLYSQIRPTMLAYAAGILGGDVAAAEDAVDEAFADIWRLAGKFNAVGNASAWIRRIVRNKAIDIVRKKSDREVSADDTVIMAFEDHAPNPEQAAVSSNEAQWLRGSLAALSPEQREVIVLCYFEGLSVQEIAEQTGALQGTVKTRLFYARQKMHDWLAKTEQAPVAAMA